MSEISNITPIFGAILSHFATYSYILTNILVKIPVLRLYSLISAKLQMPLVWRNFFSVYEGEMEVGMIQNISPDEQYLGGYPKK